MRAVPLNACFSFVCMLFLCMRPVPFFRCRLYRYGLLPLDAWFTFVCELYLCMWDLPLHRAVPIWALPLYAGCTFVCGLYLCMRAAPPPPVPGTRRRRSSAEWHLKWSAKIKETVSQVERRSAKWFPVLHKSNLHVVHDLWLVCWNIFSFLKHKKSTKTR